MLVLKLSGIQQKYIQPGQEKYLFKFQLCLKRGYREKKIFYVYFKTPNKCKAIINKENKESILQDFKYLSIKKFNFTVIFCSKKSQIKNKICSWECIIKFLKRSEGL